MEILIVDDSEVLQNSLKKMLEPLDCISLIHSVSNITAAKLILETIKPVVVITDIHMINGNGFELLKYMGKKHKELKSIMITSYDYPQFKQKALKLGVDHFLSKTKDMDRLIPIISSMSKH